MSNIVESRPHRSERKPFDATKVVIILSLPFVGAGVWVFVRMVFWAQEHVAALVPWLIGLGLVLALVIGTKAWFIFLRHKHEAQRREIELEQQRAALQFDRNLAQAVLIAASDPNADFTTDRDRSFTVTRSLSVRAIQRPYRVQEDQEQIAAPQEALQIPPPKITPIYYRDVVDSVPKGHMLLGVRRDQTARTGKWNDVKTLLVAGKSGSGKSVTMSSKAYEARRQIQARFIVFDPHFHKPESLSNRMMSLTPYLFPGTGFAWEDAAMVQNIGVAIKEYNRRRAGGERPFPVVIMGDEINRLIEDRYKQFIHPITEEKVSMSDLVLELIRLCGWEGRGFGMFGIFGAQELKGIAKVRRAVHSIAFHRVKAVVDLAGMLKKEDAEQALHLPVGATLFLDDDGEVEWLQQVITDGSEVGQEDNGPSSVTGSLVKDSTFYNENTVPRREQIGLPLSSAQSSKLNNGRWAEDAWEGSGRSMEDETPDNSFVLKKMLAEIGKMKADGASNDAILRHYGLRPGGRNNQELKTVVDVLTGLDRAATSE